MQNIVSCAYLLEFQLIVFGLFLQIVKTTPLQTTFLPRGNLSKFSSWGIGVCVVNLGLLIIGLLLLVTLHDSL